jgi:hypothetical protein
MSAQEFSVIFFEICSSALKHFEAVRCFAVHNAEFGWLVRGTDQ